MENEEILEAFKNEYMNKTSPIKLLFYSSSVSQGRTTLSATVDYAGEVRTLEAGGNGPLDALTNALRELTGRSFEIMIYNEHALERSSSSIAVSYISVKEGDGICYWGAGTDSNINTSSMYALVSAVNKLLNADK